MKNSATVFSALIVGVPTAIGAAIGSAVGVISQEIPGLCIALGAGAMAILTIRELLPLAFKYKSKISVIWLIIGVAAGAVLVLVL